MSLRSLTYMKYSFDELFMTCQPSKVVHQIFKKMVHGPKMSENH